MPKSRPSRSSLAVPLLAGSLCLGSGCVSAPQPVAGPPPSPIPCPKGARNTYKLHHMEKDAGITFEEAPDGRGIIRKGEVLHARLVGNWGDLPVHTPFTGHVWFWKGSVYGRLTQLILPSGESQPICAQLVFFPYLGVAMEPGSTPTVAYVSYSAWVSVVDEDT